MVGRVLQVTGTALVITVAAVTPLLVTTSAPPASADTVIDGCTIVSNPSPTHYTNCPGANLAGASLNGLNLSYADFSGATFAQCSPGSPPNCAGTDLTDANLTDANVTNIVGGAAMTSNCGGFPCASSAFPIFVGSNLTGANMSNTHYSGVNFTDANLTGANLTQSIFSEFVNFCGCTFSATLTGATFTGTILVPSNESVTATSQAGAVATWSTPAGLPGATPGSCTPASGSTFHLFSNKVTCQVTDNNGDVATGSFMVNVMPTTQYFTWLGIPSNGAVLSGTETLDAAAGDGPGVTSVVFEASGGTLSDQVVATAKQTLYGWIGQWNTAGVPNGAYNLQSVATDAANNTDASTPVSITVDNTPPSTSVLVPSNGATLSGSTTLDASASNATSVEFRLFGGSFGYSAPVLCTATLTYYGWLCSWNSATVPNGSYNLLSEASNSSGTAFSSGTRVTVKN